jgi:hypothetical protein
MRRLLLLGVLTVACGHDRGLTLDLSLQSDCGLVDHYVVSVTTTPPSSRAGGGGDVTVTPPTHDVLLLLPVATTHADVLVTAFDASGKAFGTASDSIDLRGPGAFQRTIMVSFAECVDGGTELPPTDLLAPDLAGLDLINAHLLFGVSVQGAFGANLYEAEGSTAPAPDDGVALLATGVGLGGISTLTLPSGFTHGPVYVSSDGTQLATSLKLPVDPAHNASAGAQSVPITFGSGADAQSTSFAFLALDELTGGSASVITNGTSPRRYSTVNLSSGSTLTLPGPSGPAFLLVTGAFTADAIVATTAAGGFPGCASNCGGANGPGRGMPANGGGGGSYGTMAPGTGAGMIYGDPSVIGLPGGSGGGPGSVAGGNGGASVRILGGSVSVGSVAVNGDPGQSAGTLSAGASGGGAGAGGALLLQSLSALVVGQAHADGGTGGAGALAGVAGSNGGAGRVRFDAASPQQFGATVSPSLGYIGAMIASDFPTAHQSASLSQISVVCGSSTRVQILVDGQLRGSATCDALATSAGRLQVNISPPLTADGAIHLVCAKSLPMSMSGSFSDYYSGSLAEDTTCRSLVLVN